MIDYQKIASSHPDLKRCKVWCRTCRHEQQVDPAEALKSGWPKCCGFTMTVDHPDTWEALHAGN